MMIPYNVKTPMWLRMIFPKGLLWKMRPETKPAVYITFDDGPNPPSTPFILEQLARYNGKATFFCIGKNVVLYPETYQQIIEKGHRVANHTHNHINGWKTDDIAYMENIAMAEKYIDSNLFRPPYGMIRRSQSRKIKQTYPDWQICMWDVLSADFDVKVTPEKCLDNVLKNIKPDSIVLFHDSDKAWPRMSYALPHVLEYCHRQGWEIKGLPFERTKGREL